MMFNLQLKGSAALIYSANFGVSWALTSIFVLVGVAFVTLYERKILGLSQLRLGPNKTSAGGLFQPGSDAIKLFFKMNSVIMKNYKVMFSLTPLMALLIVLILWHLPPTSTPSAVIQFSFPFMLMILSLNVYPLLFMGWSSNNSYSATGALRGVAQSISYEISLAFILMSLGLILFSENFHVLMNNPGKIPATFLILTFIPLWAISVLAETNRAPFDFAEGESELVSGFNTEYGSSSFALIFMAEYASIMFLSALTSILLFNYFWANSLVSTLLVFAWVWARSTFPRHRYDLLMNLAWKSVLPLTLTLLAVMLIALYLS